MMSDIPIDQRTLDWRPEFDDRSRNYPIRALVPEPLPVSKVWPRAPQLDQGREGACVGFGWAGELGAAPAIVEVSNDLARGIYHRARQLDEWPGEDYEGSSVLAGAKAVTELGHIAQYRWAFGIEDLILALGHHGPAVIGIPWKDSMARPKPNGVLDCSGRNVGGHCVYLYGVLLTWLLPTEPVFDYVIGANSWGPDWGLDGTFYMRLDDLDNLLNDSGEACIPVVRSDPVLPSTSYGP